VSAKARGLGRGLDALLPKVDKGIQQVPVSKVAASPLQPRQRFDEASIAELADSVRERGVLQPILVRPTGAGYEVVAGERRLRAARLAGLETVPAVVREMSDQEALEVAIVENLQREDLNDVEQARAYKQLLDFGLSQEQVAKAVGKSRSAVANTLRLLTLDDEVLDALEKGVITAGHARAILAQPEVDRAWAFQEIVGKGLSVRQAEQLKRPAARASKGPRVSPYRGLEEDLSRYAGTRVRITGGRRGKIELHFHGEDELQRLLDLIGYRP